MRLHSRFSLVVALFTAQIAAQIFIQKFEGLTSSSTGSSATNAWKIGSSRTVQASMGLCFIRNYIRHV